MLDINFIASVLLFAGILIFYRISVQAFRKRWKANEPYGFALMMLLITTALLIIFLWFITTGGFSEIY
ncbi:hypothetical protein [Shimazuella kribbensis]|uniref:hypothetical protein n=1 Tax=Shimazuella kribbensis TaxID=139808 RepID=UPI0004128262|nr:hypothetical protein [Shimazuella kribbensis]